MKRYRRLLSVVVFYWIALVMSSAWLLTAADIDGSTGRRSSVHHPDVKRTPPATDDDRDLTRHDQAGNRLPSPPQLPAWVALPVWNRQLHPRFGWSRRIVGSAKVRHRHQVVIFILFSFHSVLRKQ